MTATVVEALTDAQHAMEFWTDAGCRVALRELVAALTTPPAADGLTELETKARAHIAAIDVMYEVDRGVGGLPPEHFAAYQEWHGATEGSYSHADTVLRLIELVRTGEVRPRGTVTERGGWVCAKCDGSALEHSLTTSTCVWEPEWRGTVTDAEEMPDTFQAALGELVVDSEGDGINHVRHITLRDVLGQHILSDVAAEAWSLVQADRS